MMATTPPRAHNHAAAPETPKSFRKRRNGHWSDGTWWCNCDPPRKAILREVRKNSPNKGKFFWTCQAYPFCTFFLWRDAARARETGPAASSQAAPEPPQPKTPTLTQRTLASFGYPVTPRRRLSNVDDASTESGSEDDSTEDDEMSQEARRAIMEPPRTPQSAKRKQDDLDDDDFFEHLDSDGERELEGLLSSKSAANRDQAGGPETTNPYTTPTTTRAGDMVSGLPTPSVTRTLFPGSTSKRYKTVSFEEPAEDVTSSAASSATITPTTTRTQPPPTSSPGEASCDVTKEVMDLLHDQDIDASTLKAVRNLLETSARKAKGIAMGRDSARDALREKGENIARLQDRVTALENKEKMLNSQLTHTKANLMHMYQGL
ncbi:DNA topoisomerase 3-alpha [Paramyrothecium foliicola]|nr:DNA topoisomerase 3-alpha [Paramyrothecium foliicola]